ncbi:hypothetical protein [Kozakia baliensis]|uniref:Uncharacterized protein n=1 Tax=Kozakia baliensis TaxID=153496 RepID=A0A1D8UWZ3_9PROT|nr:hypothetical protein [Kozakia baliensis]AOX18198.1 hypothetical protein A0U89_07930 [Kozakia baliensis]GBR24921.1 hypothetical protein AA0488_0509 [Kozakia baliensis NRIC 0488]GEL63847.1 hypothetical protein KBA01_11330 [Kozakia baliensis]
MSSPILWSLVLTLHVLCVAFWVGGGAFAALITRSSLTLLDQAQRQSVQLQYLNRYFRGLWHVVPLALISGWLLIIHMGGFANVIWPINAMQLLAILMAIVFLNAFYGPFKAARRAIRPQPAMFNAVRLRIVAMVALGVLAILCGALGSGI